jgi:hypothetical protein
MSIALYTTDSKANEVATHVPVEAAAVAGGVWWRGWLRGGWDDESSGSRPARLERCVGRYPPLPQSGGSCCLLHSPCLHIPHSTLPHTLTHSLTSSLTISSEHSTSQHSHGRSAHEAPPRHPHAGPVRGARHAEEPRGRKVSHCHTFTHSLTHSLTHPSLRYIAPKVSRRIASVVRKEAIINGKHAPFPHSFTRTSCPSHCSNSLTHSLLSFSYSTLLCSAGTYGNFSPAVGGWDPAWDTPRKIVTLRPYRGHKRERTRPERCVQRTPLHLLLCSMLPCVGVVRVTDICATLSVSQGC